MKRSIVENRQTQAQNTAQLSQALEVRDEEIRLLKIQLAALTSQKAEDEMRLAAEKKAADSQIVELVHQNADLQMHVEILELGVNLLSPPAKYNEFHAKLQIDVHKAADKGMLCTFDANALLSPLPEKIKGFHQLLQVRNKLVLLKALSEQIDRLTSLALSSAALQELSLPAYLQKGSELENWSRTHADALTRITQLSIHKFNINALPKQTFELYNLKQLSLIGNQLTTLPSEIGKLTQLKHLYLQDNLISEFPTEIGLLSNLEGVACENNRLTSLPTQIGQLLNLTFLHAHHNQLAALPTEIGQLTNLATLLISTNALTCLPTEIGRLSHLKKLGAMENAITSLPTEIGQLLKLSDFFIQQNRLYSLPPTLLNLPNLKKVIVDEHLMSSSIAISLSAQGTKIDKPCVIQ